MKIFSKQFFLLCLCAMSYLALQTGCGKDKGKKEAAVATHWEPGQVFYDKTHWTECIVGNMPLVISVPHGGNMKPAGVPDRTCPDATTVTDLNTIELAQAISDAMYQAYRVRPYLIICHLKRTKIDQNRDIDEGTCGHTAMVAPWHQFHDYIDTAVTEAAAGTGKVLYIDLHGHGHTKQRLELGYSLTKNDLGSLYTSSGLDALWHKSSLNNLGSIKNANDFRDHIIGEGAFGTMMEDAGFRAVPSKQEPYPNSSDPYFDGGYNTRYYTSSDYPRVFGWQIESNYTGVRDAAGRPLFAKAFVQVIIQYMKNNMGYKP